MSRPRALAPARCAGLATVAVVAVLLPSPDATPRRPRPPPSTANPVTPGNFTGYGFDQCLTPTPGRDEHLAQPLAVPRRRHLHLRRLPGLPQPAEPDADLGQHPAQQGLAAAADHPRPAGLLPAALPALRGRLQINPKPGRTNGYSVAKKQGTTEGARSVAAAQALGIPAGSTLWYDLEGFRPTPTPTAASRRSVPERLDDPGARARLHGRRLLQRRLRHQDAGRRAGQPARQVRPARRDLDRALGRHRQHQHDRTSATTAGDPAAGSSSTMGGHDETWGGVRINIDRNFLDLGQGSIATPESHCGGVQVGFTRMTRSSADRERQDLTGDQVKALQCLLKEQGLYAGQLGGSFNARAAGRRTGVADQDRLPRQRGVVAQELDDPVRRRRPPVLKFGSAGPTVRRVQRALNATRPTLALNRPAPSTSAPSTRSRAWQEAVGIAGLRRDEPRLLAWPCCKAKR